MKFAAIDFETANYHPHSACAVGIVRVENGRTIDTLYSLIRPPSSYFQFTDVHGITWQDACQAPNFAEVWTQIQQTIAGVDYLVAHNATFDRRVLLATCNYYQINAPEITGLPFICTVKIARQVLKISPAKLSNVCRVLDIELNHHHALSDAAACAQILVESQKRSGS
jgi:DNA polymerase III subunit epsilon